MRGTKALDAMPEPRRVILLALKGSGPLAIADLAAKIGITYEAIRQHLGQLEVEGWVARRVQRGSTSLGRPRSLYHLTAAGDHLFPKEYADLAVELIDAAAERLGPDAVRELLTEVARRKVRQWAPALEGRPLDQQLEALQNIYIADDPFCRVERDDQGNPRLVEMNCPFLEVARRRPALCSVTVSVLRHLLGREVVRTERFQAGDGRCVFQVLADRPVAEEGPLFDWEPDPPGSDDEG